MSCYRTAITVLLASALLVVACAHSSSDDDALAALASNLSAIANAVAAEADDSGSAPNLEGVELVTAATAHDPTLMAPFKELYVTARKRNLLSSVLVCDLERKHALFEDAACTLKLDADFSTYQEKPSCAFTLDLVALCK